MGNQARQRFAAIMSKGGEDINLAEAALLIAQEEYNDLDVSAYLAHLDQIADEVNTHSWDDQESQSRIKALNRHLFEDQGFRGNVENYYDPKNSFLNEVLDRRTGIPITLSIVYLEVGWRLKLQVQGVGFPGHFLVKCVHSDREIIIDPFHRGKVLTEEDCQSRLDKVYGGRLRFQPGFLAAATKRQILVRMLTNLKGIYSAVHDYRRALDAIERILVIDPTRASEIRDRGMLRMHLKQPAQAIADLERYVTMNPQADDVEEIRRRLRDLRQAQGSLN